MVVKFIAYRNRVIDYIAVFENTNVYTIGRALAEEWFDGRPEILGLRPARTSFKEIAPNGGSLQRSHFVTLDSEIIPVICSSLFFEGPSKLFLIVNLFSQFTVHVGCLARSLLSLLDWDMFVDYFGEQLLMRPADVIDVIENVGDMKRCILDVA